MTKETYIGNGVHASITEPWDIKLRAARDDHDDVIHLNVQQFADLMRFMVKSGFCVFRSGARNEAAH